MENTIRIIILSVILACAGGPGMYAGVPADTLSAAQDAPAAKQTFADRLTIGGYGEAVATYNFYSDNFNRYSQPEKYSSSKGHGRFDLPHVVLMLGYDFGRGWSMGMEIEFEHGGTEAAVELEGEEAGEFEKEVERGGEVALEQFWIQKSFSSALNVRAGHIVVPVGRTNAHHLPVEFFTVYRPEGENTIFPCTWHETGLSIWGKAGDWRYEAQLLPGLNSTQFNSTGWIHDGSASPYEFKVANKFAGAFRVDNYSIRKLRLSVSGYAGDSFGNSVLGFHGIEYILFRNGSPRNVADITELELIYATAVAGDLRNRCWQMELSWAGEAGTAAELVEKVAGQLELPYTIGTGSYGDNMLNAGKAGSTYSSLNLAMQEIIGGCCTIADEVGTMKIGAPHSGEDINYIESPYSHKSIQDFYDNIISIENVYNGGVEGDRSATESLHAFFADINPELDARITAAIDAAKSAISNMASPFVENYSDPSAGAAMDACIALDAVLGEAIEALGNL